MADKEKCARCGDRAETIDNIAESTFWGSMTTETETTTVCRVRLRATFYRRNLKYGTPVLNADEKRPLCSDCNGLLVGRFLQGRGVDAMPGKEGW